MFAKDDFDAAVGEMTGGGIRGNSFTNMFTGGEGIAGLIKNQTKKFAMNKLMGGSGGIGGIGGIDVGNNMTSFSQTTIIKDGKKITTTTKNGTTTITEELVDNIYLS